MPGAVTLWLAAQVPGVRAGAVPSWSMPWVPSFDVALAFRLDGLSLLFALIVAGIGIPIFAYSAAYMRRAPRSVRFTAILLAFMVSMLGLVTADDLLLLYVFWEATTLTSFLLIGTDHTDRESRRAAMQALLVTGGGGLCLLAGLLTLGTTTGIWTLSGLIAAGSVADHPLAGVVFGLVLAAAFTKSAQVPFHFWLPQAMAAPTPVSAYLHSATMVKAGLYLLARLHPVLSEHVAWMPLLTGVGVATAVWGAVVALGQTDLKKLLAYTTVMGLGAIMALLGGSGEGAVMAALTYLVVHALYKSGLFMVAGAIDHATGTRDVRDLGGLHTAMPLSFAAAALAAASMAGLPPFLGFVGKEAMYEGALHLERLPWLVAMLLVIANAATMVAALRLAFDPFVFHGGRRPRSAHEGAPGLWAGALAVGILALVCGLVPETLGAWLIRPAVAAVIGHTPEPALALWHGVTPAFLLSLTTVALGAAGFVARGRVFALVVRWTAVVPSGDRGYGAALQGLHALGRAAMGLVQNGLLSRYVGLTVAFVVLVLGAALVRNDVWPVLPRGLPDLRFFEWIILAVLPLGAITTVVSRSRLLSIAALSMVGTAIAMIYLLHGGPDVAITQLMVETLVMVVIAAVMLRLPSFRFTQHLRNARPRALHVAVSVGAGGVVAAALLAVTATPFPSEVSRWYLDHAYTEAHARNVVNAILVDFRAFDTLGEITVVTLAGLGAYALIRMRGGRKRNAGEGEGEERP